MSPVAFRMLLVPCALLFAASSLPSVAAPNAPASQAASSTSAIPAARPADVSSMEAVIDAVYEVISGPKDQKRDWNRMRSLFVPGARLISVHAGKDGASEARVMSVEDYIRLAQPLMEKDGFFERESHRTVDRYGGIAQVFSTYESRHAAADAKPFQRGINSFQLLFDGHRWWVVTIYWQGEHPDLPLPKQYGG
ncbi:hypothetical protein [Rhodanobacter glycinis]|uniref:hypothetical protein n=1 Tax=Rhodanobacter glycinis TaxID=582702 RepID=UPI0019603447|nr:hypothetical protein [Rhodanobacter glycinis]